MLGQRVGQLVGHLLQHRHRALGGGLCDVGLAGHPAVPGAAHQRRAQRGPVAELRVAAHRLTGRAHRLAEPTCVVQLPRVVVEQLGVLGGG